MIFGAVPLDAANGAILAHSQRLPERVLRKGTRLDEAAIAALRAAGIAEVIAARLEPGDVGEDDAAGRLADRLLAPLIGRTRAATGRVNLLAEAPALLRIDAAGLDRVNLVDEALTVATLPDFTPVAPGDMIATIKIIPFAVPGATLAATEAEAAGPLVRLHPFRPLRAGLVLTELPGLKASILEGTIEATQRRVEGLTGTLLPPLRCAHDETAIAACLETLLAQGAELLLIAGASAVVDRRDVGPAAIVRAGGAITHFGMPVDPGNLICLGEIGRDRRTIPALVLPGCARSPKANGIDIVLARLFAGLAVTPGDVMRLGLGGLLKDTSARPLPRARAAAKRAPRNSDIACIVLAAGRSQRMAPHNKLLLQDRTGKAMIARTVDNLLSTSARPVIVVTGHMAREVEAALAGRPVTFVRAPDFAAGLSASLKSGIAAVPEPCRAAVVCLGDMPLVTGRILDRIIAAYDPEEGRRIIVPTRDGARGNPVLWDRHFFADIARLAGDAGARSLLAEHAEDVAEVEVETDAVLRDFDTPEQLGALPERLRPAPAP